MNDFPNYQDAFENEEQPIDDEVEELCDIEKPCYLDRTRYLANLFDTTERKCKQTVSRDSSN